MPELDGWALLARLRVSNPNLPVIVMSAVEPAAARRDMFSVDHTVFLRKPFDVEALLTSVERLIGAQQS